MFGQIKIDLDYSESITIDKIERILNMRFPQYPTYWPRIWRYVKNAVALKKHHWAIVCVRIKHNKEKNLTRILVYKNMDPWALLYMGPLWSLISLRDLDAQVEAVIREELPRMLASEDFTIGNFHSGGQYGEPAHDFASIHPQQEDLYQYGDSDSEQTYIDSQVKQNTGFYSGYDAPYHHRPSNAYDTPQYGYSQQSRNSSNDGVKSHKKSLMMVLLTILAPILILVLGAAFQSDLLTRVVCLLACLLGVFLSFFLVISKGNVAGQKVPKYKKWSRIIGVVFAVVYIIVSILLVVFGVRQTVLDKYEEQCKSVYWEKIDGISPKIEFVESKTSEMADEVYDVYSIKTVPFNVLVDLLLKVDDDEKYASSEKKSYPEVLTFWHEYGDDEISHNGESLLYFDNQYYYDDYSPYVDSKSDRDDEIQELNTMAQEINDIRYLVIIKNKTLIKPFYEDGMKQYESGVLECEATVYSMSTLEPVETFKSTVSSDAQIQFSESEFEEVAIGKLYEEMYNCIMSKMAEKYGLKAETVED